MKRYRTVKEIARRFKKTEAEIIELVQTLATGDMGGLEGEILLGPAGVKRLVEALKARNSTVGNDGFSGKAALPGEGYLPVPGRNAGYRSMAPGMEKGCVVMPGYEHLLGLPPANPPGEVEPDGTPSEGEGESQPQLPPAVDQFQPVPISPGQPSCGAEDAPEKAEESTVEPLPAELSDTVENATGRLFDGFAPDEGLLSNTAENAAGVESEPAEPPDRGPLPWPLSEWARLTGKYPFGRKEGFSHEAQDLEAGELLEADQGFEEEVPYAGTGPEATTAQEGDREGSLTRPPEACREAEADHQGCPAPADGERADWRTGELTRRRAKEERRMVSKGGRRRGKRADGSTVWSPCLW